jgi:hypothetical protein
MHWEEYLARFLRSADPRLGAREAVPRRKTHEITVGDFSCGRIDRV